MAGAGPLLPYSPPHALRLHLSRGVPPAASLESLPARSNCASAVLQLRCRGRRKTGASVSLLPEFRREGKRICISRQEQRELLAKVCTYRNNYAPSQKKRRNSDANVSTTSEFRGLDGKGEKNARPCGGSRRLRTEPRFSVGPGRQERPGLSAVRVRIGAATMEGCADDRHHGGVRG